MAIDPKKFKQIADLLMVYWHLTIGSLISVVAFWLFFTKKIDKDSFAYIIGAVVTLKGLWKPSEKGGNDV